MASQFFINAVRRSGGGRRSLPNLRRHEKIADATSSHREERCAAETGDKTEEDENG